MDGQGGNQALEKPTSWAKKKGGFDRRCLERSQSRPGERRGGSINSKEKRGTHKKKGFLGEGLRGIELCLKKGADRFHAPICRTGRRQKKGNEKGPTRERAHQAGKQQHGQFCGE